MIHSNFSSCHNRASGENTPQDNSLHSSMRFEDYPEDPDEDEITKNEMDFRVQTKRQTRPGSDVVDYPQNPYGDREIKNNSLFFADGLRSVDFVLVWKKLLPPNDDEKSAALQQRDRDEVKKKEGERDDRRDTFEEHLIGEGLEIEREIVDEEIHFVKLHAPIEVLRRYAEILKLRLPMKEVSNLLI